MAGSYNHVTPYGGKLLGPGRFPQFIENLGDAYETVEEMYGMIWALADMIVDAVEVERGITFPAEVQREARKFYVDQAQENWKRGFEFSPGRQE